MSVLAQQEFGPFTNLVADAGTLIAVAAALGMAWRRRAKWEPSEIDIPNGPQRVGGLVAVAGLVLLWATYRPAPHSPGLRVLLIVLVSVCVVALLVYSFLTSTQTYVMVEALDGQRHRTVRIIGGFRTTRRAAEWLRSEHGDSLQRFFEGSAYDVDRVWTRGSRALAKTCFVLAYLLLTVSGTLALAAAAIMIS